MDADDRAWTARELDDLAGGWGVPAAIQHAVDHLPGSAVADVGFDVATAMGTLLGDLAVVVESCSPETESSDQGGAVGVPGSGGVPGPMGDEPVDRSALDASAGARRDVRFATPDVTRVDASGDASPDGSGGAPGPADGGVS
ncbi:hypothetical protein [Mobilicoccus pelagius]|uniref:Uncharacterized protein n=1 Tax=Mobilicoccus pelagius NBRC 104925 TaxID=1089455 RepID=H5UNJ5_9MICO|nr:hypothetical protein [Mobilicoccus pelagius]GAB47303.1 hypothetical protein MOPEL_007_01190 [Mobilicoccus pelagius NBRC 104925]